MDISRIAEVRIREYMELGEEKFVVYPMGKVGKNVREVMRNSFNQEPFAMVDNESCIQSKDIISFDELKEIEEWYVLVFATTKKDVIDEIRPYLRELRRPIINIASYCISGSDEIVYDATDLYFDFNSPKMVIEELKKREIEELFERTRGQWKLLGDEEPFWGVITDNDYKAENISQDAIEDFYDSGRGDVERLVQTLIRVGRIVHNDETKGLSITEIGCGCGRNTRELANFFREIYAFDISSGNMKIAKKYASRKNIHYELVNSIYDYNALPKVDVVYSIIVLQHNIPPMIEYILKNMLLSLNFNGVGYFQIPSYIKDYSFSYEKVAKSEHIMDMHVLPENIVFDIIRECGCILLECYTDSATGVGNGYISQTYVVRKVN